MRDRVKIIADENSSVSIYSDRIQSVVQNFQSNAEYSIIDILEFYNINKFISARIEPSFWNQDFINKYKKFGIDSKSIIFKFFNKVDNENLLDLFSKIGKYQKEFWECFEKYKVYQRISNSTFELLLYTENVIFENVLHRKYIVDYFGESVKSFFMSNVVFAQILLDKYVIMHLKKIEEIYLPTQMSIEDKEKIIIGYIDSDIVHINYLEAIVNVKNTNDFKISGRTKANATKRIKQEQTSMAESGLGIYYENCVTFSRIQKEDKIYKFDCGNVNLSFSVSWIEENKDYATLLNNFIYLFDFADIQMRINLVSKNSELGPIENFLLVKSCTDYPIGMVFNHKNQIAKLEMIAYYKELQRQNVFMENVIEWFFEGYLKDEFSINNFVVNLSRSDSYLEKCKCIFPDIDRAVKQYKLYVEDGEIDKDLLEQMDTIRYDEIPSLLTKKYVYGKGNDFKLAEYYLTVFCNPKV